MRYFYHAESDSLWEQEAPPEHVDGLVEEIDRAAFLRLLTDHNGDDA